MAAPGLDAMAHPELLPLLHVPGTETKQFASVDLSGGNADGDLQAAFAKYVDANGDLVIFDEVGPGCLYRQQINVWGGFEYAAAMPDRGDARILYYFDDEPTPRIDMTINELFDGRTPPFEAPLVFMEDEPITFVRLRRFANSYYPLPFERRLKIAVRPNETWGKDPYNWYQFTYLLYPPGTAVQSWPAGAPDTQAVRQQWLQLGSDPKPSAGNVAATSTVSVASGSSATLFSLRAAGSIASLRLFVEPYSESVFYGSRLRMTWDDSAEPAVDLPLGYFFGGGGQDYAFHATIPGRSLTTLFSGFDGQAHSFYAFWPMPFWHAARIELVNQSGQDLDAVRCEVEWKPETSFAYPAGSAGYFSARRTVQESPDGAPFATVFEESGRGHVVGISFWSEDYATDGDEFTYLDGSRTPQIHGDGTEDDHNQGWGGAAYQAPLWGGLIDGYQGAYRFYMNDSYIFSGNIRIRYELEENGSLPSRTDVVVFYYRAPSGGILDATDELDVGNEADERNHAYSVTGQTWQASVTSAYDGYEKARDIDSVADDGRGYSGASRFTLSVDPRNRGVRLRRRIHRTGNGVQTAEVWLDGARLERPWRIVTGASAPASQAWMDSDYELPARLTRGKDHLTLELRHLDSTKGELNDFRLWAFSYRADD
jgi:hypothetical protein